MQTCVDGESLVSYLTWSWRHRKRTRVFRTERQHFAHCSTNYMFYTRCVHMIFAPNS